MTEQQLDILKKQMPISFNITISTDYPNGMHATKNQAEYTRPDGSIGSIDFVPEYDAFARVAGTMGKYGVILTWKYDKDPDSILVDVTGPDDGRDEVIPINTLRDYLIKLKS